MRAHQNGALDQMLAQNQMVRHQQDALMYGLGMWQMQRGAEAPQNYSVVVADGGFAARFECPETRICFELISVERPAAERGMRHYVHRWNSALHNLKLAGLKTDELGFPLACIKPRLVEEAQKERDLEEGVRQAESKSKALLVMCLTPEQVAEFNERQSFTVQADHRVSGFPAGAFRIKKGSSFNVEHVESGETFCVVSQEKVPVYDQMLTQKLLLENEPERFFKTANRSAGLYSLYPGAINYFGGRQDATDVATETGPRWLREFARLFMADNNPDRNAA